MSWYAASGSTRKTARHRQSRGRSFAAKSGGALLGDRIRMNAIAGGRVFMRSARTRGAESRNLEEPPRRDRGLQGRRIRPGDRRDVRHRPGDAAIVPLADASLYVMTPEYGAASQLEKIDMLDFADFVAHQQVRPQGWPGRAAGREEAIPRNRQALRTAPPRTCRYTAHRFALQRRRRYRALPGYPAALVEHGLK